MRQQNEMQDLKQLCCVCAWVNVIGNVQRWCKASGTNELKD